MSIMNINVLYESLFKDVYPKAVGGVYMKPAHQVDLAHELGTPGSSWKGMERCSTWMPMASRRRTADLCYRRLNVSPCGIICKMTGVYFEQLLIFRCDICYFITKVYIIGLKY